MTTLEPINEDEYAKAFKIFSERTTEYDIMLQTFINNISKFINTKILSIGAGTGFFDNKILHYFQDFEYYAVEPNNMHIISLKENLNKYNNIHIIHDYYTNKINFDIKFDYILFSHSLYSFKNYNEIITHAMKSLSPDGKMIIFHMSSIGIYDFVNTFHNEIRFSKSPDAFHDFCGVDIVKSLNNIYDTDINFLNAFIDFSDVLYDEDLLHNILSFFCQMNTRKINKITFYKMIEYIISHMDNLFFIHKTNIITIKNIH